MRSIKKLTLAYWFSTSIIFVFEGLMPALTGHTDMAKEGIRYLGYPEYFGMVLVFFKIIGAIILIVPLRNVRIKEWAYAGFTYNFLFATISHFIVDGLSSQAFFPLIILAILALSYFTYHRLNAIKTLEKITLKKLLSKNR